MLAVISDIHSNGEALTSVLDDIERRGIKRVVCLGDVVGYGPHPGPCLDLVQQSCEATIMGNHDNAVLYEPARFNLGAEAAVFWTRKTIESDGDAQATARRWDFLGSRPVRHRLTGELYGAREIMLAHGSPRRPVNEYLFPDDIYNNAERITASFREIEHLCFVGHTHVPGVFTQSMEFLSPEDLGGTYEFDRDKTIVNVGSVGQPRDRDPRACYVVVSPGQIEFARVEYDVEAIASQILANTELDDYLGTRLREGR